MSTIKKLSTLFLLATGLFFFTSASVVPGTSSKGEGVGTTASKKEVKKEVKNQKRLFRLKKKAAKAKKNSKRAHRLTSKIDKIEKQQMNSLAKTGLIVLGISVLLIIMAVVLVALLFSGGTFGIGVAILFYAMYVLGGIGITVGLIMFIVGLIQG